MTAIASARQWSLTNTVVTQPVAGTAWQPVLQIYRIHLQGTIAAGKSTVIESLRAQPHRVRALLGPEQTKAIPDDAVFAYCAEPIERWHDCNGENLLAAFYRDPARWAMTFQLWALQTRIAAMNAAVVQALGAASRAAPPVVLVCERSIDTDAAIFAPMLRASGMISAAEWRVYEVALPTHEFYFRCQLDAALRGAGFQFGLLAVSDLAEVYLRLTPAEAFARVQQRARSSEVSGKSALTLDYMRALHEQHERVLGAGTFAGIPVLTLEPAELARRLQ